MQPFSLYPVLGPWRTQLDLQLDLGAPTQSQRLQAQVPTPSWKAGPGVPQPHTSGPSDPNKDPVEPCWPHGHTDSSAS